MDCSRQGVCSNSYPLSQWCYLTISSSAAHFSFCLPSFPASRSFPVSWLFTLGCQIWELQQQFFQYIFKVDFLYDWWVWSPCIPRDSQESSSATQLKASILQCSAFFIVSCIYIWLLENHSFYDMHFWQQSNVSAF